MKFIDEIEIFVKAGNGGKGCVSFRREKFVPLGGPNGGDGGDGGDVIIIADSSLTSLVDLRYSRRYTAKAGYPGLGSDKHGKNAHDVIIKVPVGTIVKDSGTLEVLVDLTTDEQSFLCVKGGKGGRGNARFATSTNQAPRHAQPGLEGEELDLHLELKLLADVGIIGFPNAGKSTLISRISAARPRIADYPFTTLVPNLGVVRYGDYGGFVVADIPGLIAGAHKGKGLGIRFLKHIERTSLFIHMLDLSPEHDDNPDRSPVTDYEKIRTELGEFNPELLEKPQIVALNKTDLPEAEEKASELLDFFELKGIKVFQVSAVTGQGLKELVNFAGAELERLKLEEVKA